MYSTCDARGQDIAHIRIALHKNVNKRCMATTFQIHMKVGERLFEDIAKLVYLCSGGATAAVCGYGNSGLLQIVGP